MNHSAAPARITTEAVFEAIEKHPVGDFTTFDIAEAMGVPEYPVRAAVSWLLKSGTVQRAGARKCWTKPVKRERCGNEPGKPEPYWATTYMLREHGGPADFAALNRIFGVGW